MRNIILATDRSNRQDFLPPRNPFAILSIHMRIQVITIIVAGIVFGSCKQPPPKISVNVDSLATVYAELLVLNERYNLSKDSLSARQYEADYTDILQKYNYTKDRFSRELETVSKSPDDFRHLCDRALAEFQQMRRKHP